MLSFPRASQRRFFMLELGEKGAIVQRDRRREEKDAKRI
jgi:hypothetical protein